MIELRRRIMISVGSNSHDYPQGIWAYYADGSIRDYANADSNAIGVAVVTADCRFVLDKIRSKLAISSESGSSANAFDQLDIVKATDLNSAIVDLDGYNNTIKIINHLTSKGYSSPAISYCMSKFNGQGYLGAFGEWDAVYTNLSAVNSMLIKIGGTQVQNDWYTMTSTLYVDYATFVAAVDRRNGGYNVNFLQFSFNDSEVRAFMKITGGSIEPDDDFVDLGLPSGLLWAKGNLCKDSQGNYSIGDETDYGTYVSWGNIDGHNEGKGYNFNDTNYNSTAGKQLSANISANDAGHDICLARLGSPWHLPTKEDFQELYDNTDSEWVADYNGTGVAGRKFMKKSDHSVYVFFPASGRFNGSTLEVRGTYGNYWSASFDDSTDAYVLIFNSSSVYPQYYYYRYRGFSVRPVYNP